MQRSPLKRYDDSSATTLTVHEMLLSISHVILAVDYTYICTRTRTAAVALSSFLSGKQILKAVLDKALVACVLGASVPDLSTNPPRAAPHRVDSGRVADPPRVRGQRTLTRKKTRRFKPCRRAMRPNPHRARFFVDLAVDLDVKASRRRYGADRADPLSRVLQARRGRALAKKPRGKAVSGGRDPQTKGWSASL